MNPTLIVIPTLDPNRGLDTGHLAQKTAGCDSRLIVVHDEEESGFTKTVNRGMRQRLPGEDVCLLNDDVERFNYGWLQALSTALYSHRRNGIVTPSGNCASKTSRGKMGDEGLERSNTLPFWCALIRHSLMDDIGLLNEELIHYSSDTLYCIEAKAAGWRSVWVKPVYLWHHHEGSGFRTEWRNHDTQVMQKLLTKMVLK